jgi:hypothetical protein
MNARATSETKSRVNPAHIFSGKQFLMEPASAGFVVEA